MERKKLLIIGAITVILLALVAVVSGFVTIGEKTWEASSQKEFVGAIAMAKPGDTILLLEKEPYYIPNRGSGLSPSVTIKGIGETGTLLVGELWVNGGITLNDLTLYDSSDSSIAYNPALKTTGNVVLERVRICSDGKSCAIIGGSKEFYHPTIKIKDCEFISIRGGEGLSIDTPMADDSEIKDNVFMGFRSGICISIDMMFAKESMSYQETQDKYEELASKLNKDNVFIWVGGPVTGARG
ncbi:MAG: hypothetical protein WC123_06330 [Bacilli bacterium]